VTSIGKRIKRCRVDAGLTQVALARAAGINQGYLSEIERGKRNPGPGTLRALSVALDVPEAVLIGEGEDHDAPQLLDTRELPLYGSIPAGKPGGGQEQMEMFPILRHLWSADRYCLRLEYDSMEPTLKPGDIILVHYRADVDAEHVQGRICACLVNGEPTLKRVHVEYDGQQRLIVLRGDNPRVPPIVVRQSDDFQIQGVAIKVVSRDL